jgi:hypothetical protein
MACDANPALALLFGYCDLVQRARLELALLDPQVPRELGIVAALSRSLSGAAPKES